jgi:hypothetical protein
MIPQLSKEEEDYFRAKIRGIIRTRLMKSGKKVHYSPAEDDIYRPLKAHNDIVIGPAMTGGQNRNMSPTA